MNKTPEQRRFLRRFWPVMLWACIMIAVSSIPHLTVPETKMKNIDKLAHFFEFGIFGFLLAWGMASPHMRLRGKHVLFILAVSVLFAFLDESFQSLVPGRKRDSSDWVADMAGIAASLLLWHVIAWLRGHHQLRKS